MRFRRNPTFQMQIQRDAAYRAGLTHTGNTVAAAVRAVAPRHTGYYARSIRVVSEAEGVRVESADPFAHLVEWGSAKNPPYAPMRRGARAAGLRLRESSR